MHNAKLFIHEHDTNENILEGVTSLRKQKILCNSMFKKCFGNKGTK